MAILCDNCRNVTVKVDGDICSECQALIEESKIDRSYMHNVYMPDDLFEKFAVLVKHVEDERSGARKAIGKFLHNLKTGFIDKFTGKEINDPTPSVIIPKEKTLDRIEKILQHNLAVYAREADLDTPEDLEDWSVADQFSDDWETSLYQHVNQVVVMEEEPLESNITEEPDPGENDPTPGGSEPPAEP